MPNTNRRLDSLREKIEKYFCKIQNLQPYEQSLFQIAITGGDISYFIIANHALSR